MGHIVHNPTAIYHHSSNLVNLAQRKYDTDKAVFRALYIWRPSLRYRQHVAFGTRPAVMHSKTLATSDGHLGQNSRQPLPKQKACS